MGGFRSICFFTLLLIYCKAQDAVSSEDLKSGSPTSEEEELKSAAHAESYASSDGGYSRGESYADTNSGSSVAQSLTSSGGYGSSSAYASAQASSGSEQYLNPYSLKDINLLGLGTSGASSAKAHADALAQSSGLNNLVQGLDSYIPGTQISPYTSGSSAQAQAEAQSLVNGGGYIYNQGQYPNYNGLPLNYNLGSSSAHADAQASLNYEKIHDKNLIQGNQYPYSPYSMPGPAQAQAEAQALANADGNSYNPYISGYPGKQRENNQYLGNLNQNSAQALAEAQALFNAGGVDYVQGMNHLGYQQMGQIPGISMSQAEAQALVNADVNKYNSGVSNYIPGTGYPGYLKPAKASAEAQALINAGGYNLGHNTYQPGYIPATQGLSQAAAQAIANSGVDSYGNKNLPIKNSYLYPYGSSTAQAQAETLSGSYGNIGGFPYGHRQNGQAMAEAQAQSIAGGQGSAIANAQALSGGVNAQGTTVTSPAGYSRLIPSYEYILPHLLLEIESSLICTAAGEIYNVWSPVYKCLICACVTKFGIVAPVCTSCDGCKTPHLEPIVPIPIVPIVPEPEVIVTTPKLPTPNEASCRPLPSWQSFHNPLNPCQVCICKELPNIYGILEAHIDCSPNPECVLPPDVAPLPPTPDGLPTPLPMCEKFPQNVIFPHPMDECKLCKCEVDMTQFDIVEPRITCIPNPECNHRIVPIPGLIPHEDIITPKPLPPIPIEPIPFPDIVTPEPLPWLPVTTPKPIAPGPLPGPSPHESCRPFQPGQAFQHPWDECQICMCTEAHGLGLITIEVNCYTKKSCCYESTNEVVTQAPSSFQIIDKLCEFKTFGVEFVHPQDKCKMCTCELFGGMVKSMCKSSLNPECTRPYFSGIGSENAEAHASANSQTNVVPSYLPSMYNPTLPSSNTLYDANAMAQSGSSSHLGYHSLEPSETFNKYLGYLNHESSGYNQIKPGTNFYYPGSVNPGGSAISKAEASASAYDQKTNLNKFQGYVPFWTKTDGFNNGITGYDNIYYPSVVSNAKGNAQASRFNGGSLYQGIPASSMHATLYPNPGYELQTLYYPKQEFDGSNAHSQAQSLAQGTGSQSSSKALANVIKIKSKSAKSDVDEDSELQTLDDSTTQ